MTIGYFLSASLCVKFRCSVDVRSLDPLVLCELMEIVNVVESVVLLDLIRALSG
jgi:hypothetical protein